MHLNISLCHTDAISNEPYPIKPKGLWDYKMRGPRFFVQGARGHTGRTEPNRAPVAHPWAHQCTRGRPVLPKTLWNTGLKVSMGENGPQQAWNMHAQHGNPSCPTILQQLSSPYCACVCENSRSQRSPCTCFRIFGGFSAQKWLEWSHMSAIVPQLLNFDLYNWFFWMQHKKLPVEKYHQIFSISFLSQVIWYFQYFN